MALTLLNAPSDYLSHNEWIDWQHPDVVKKAKHLASGHRLNIDIARTCFEFVRDEIQHSIDYQRGPVTCKASDVLKDGVGYCYAKSHLLAALCRANGIPAGLCYQRLTITDKPPFCLHGLNAIYLGKQTPKAASNNNHWYRVDARGNNELINAQFTPPHEQLAFRLAHPNEQDFNSIYAKPLEAITDCLTQHKDWQTVLNNLPDAKVLA